MNFITKMSDFLPNEDKVMDIIKERSIRPTKKVKKCHECYDRVMKLLYRDYTDYEKWLTDPGLQKQMQMNIGDFIQDLIGILPGHSNFRKGHPTGLDGENTLNKTRILYEIKVYDHTTNSSSMDECINKLKRATEGTSTQPLLIQFFRTKNITPRGKYSKFLISGDDYLNNYVSPDIGGIDGLISYIERILYVREFIEEILQRVVLSNS